MRLHREQVIRAAAELVDQVGLDAFTTRLLTDKLGVQRGALYWHVKSKYELLTEVAALIVAPAFAAAESTDGWESQFRKFAHRFRGALLAHRDAARLVATYTPTTYPTTRTSEAITHAGMPTELAARFGDIIVSYVTGYVLQEQSQDASDTAGSDAVFAASIDTIIAGMHTELANNQLNTDHSNR